MSICSKALFGLLVATSSVFAFEDDPIFPSSEITQSEIFSRQFRRGTPLAHSGGVAIVTDASGNYYVASGTAVTKYDTSGTEVWSRFHTQRKIDIGMGGLEQWSYLEDWNDGTGNINQASTHDEGEEVSPFAQKALLDSAGNLYVNFVDLQHLERSLVVKFDPDGIVLWRNVTAFPQGGNCDSLLLDMVLSPDEETLILFEAVRSYNFNWKKTRLVTFSADTAQSDRNNDWTLSKLYGAPRAGETNGHNAIGVGLALNSNGDICLANHEGPENADLGSTDAKPNKLVIRRLPAPYGSGVETTNQEVKIEIASARDQEEWNDLAVNAANDIFLAGTYFFSNGFTFYDRQIIASYAGGNLSQLWKELVPSVSANTIDVDGSRLLIDATGVTITGAESDIRNSYSAGTLALARYTFAGAMVWQVVDYDYFIDDAFTDGAGNVYLLGEDFSGFAFDNDYSVWKFSKTGVLQFMVEQNAPTDRTYETYGHYSHAFDPDGNIVMAVAHADSGDPDAEFLGLPVIEIENPDVPKTTQTISFNPSANATVGQTINLNATATSGLTVVFALVSGPATLSGSQLSITGTGTVVVKASQVGDSNYESATDVQRSISAVASIRSQSITFALIKDREFSLSGFSIAPSASSGLPVAIQIRGPIRRSGNRIFATGLGRATITVSQSGGSGFSAAAAVSRSFNIVDKTKPTVKLRPPTSTSSSSVKIGGTATDNYKIVRVDYRVKTPDGKTGAFKKRPVSSDPGEGEKFDLAIAASKLGNYSVEVVPVDAAGNKGAAKTISFARN